ncbi:MAG: hypothetical protein IJG75_03925 [Spirochaetia bacterium]|nr:hypothetical protein [Spirochaetia bacterium]
MKKYIALFLLALGLTVTASAKPLVMYFSWGEFQKADVDATTAASVLTSGGQKYGYTELLAKLIAESTGSDLWRFEPENAYPAKYDPTTEVVMDESKKGIVRKVKGSPDFSKYDTIFVGVPVWWHTAPTLVTNFLQEHGKELSGKTVIPFVSYWARYQKETLEALVKATPTAEHKEGYATDKPNKSGVDSWLKRIGEKQ